MMTSEIILLEKSQIDKASQILAAAFLKDPLFSYALPQEDKVKDKLLHDIWKASLRYSLPHNCTYTTPEIKGIAIWIPPGAYPFNNLRFMLTGFYRIPFQLGWKNLKKFISPFALLDKYHTQDMPVPHWYLFGLGVSPVCQGEGIGGSLIQPVLKQADEEGLPCYLETDTPGAIRFYQKHGFEVLRTGEQPLKFWTMKREPQNGNR
ncbi:GNAT family N-acetyltransferase [Mastigocoleus testarum]|nr:GNAT family N-acetyltransferase [Mastigocoleus testarum]